MKLQEGKRYVTRDGWVTPNLEHDPTADCFVAGEWTWASNGSFFWDGSEQPMDLIAEYGEPTPTELSRLEIAARVLAHLGDPNAPGPIYDHDGLAREALRRADALIAAERETRE